MRVLFFLFAIALANGAASDDNSGSGFDGELSDEQPERAMGAGNGIGKKGKGAFSAATNVKGSKTPKEIKSSTPVLTPVKSGKKANSLAAKSLLTTAQKASRTLLGLEVATLSLGCIIAFLGSILYARSRSQKAPTDELNSIGVGTVEACLLELVPENSAVARYGAHEISI